MKLRSKLLAAGVFLGGVFASISNQSGLSEVAHAPSINTSRANNDISDTLRVQTIYLNAVK